MSNLATLIQEDKMKELIAQGEAFLGGGNHTSDHIIYIQNNVFVKRLNGTYMRYPSDDYD